MSDKVELENCPLCNGQAGEHFGLVGCDESRCDVPQASFTVEEWNTRHLTPAQAHGDELYAELEKVEWAGTDDKGYKFCLMCERYHPEFDYVDGLDLGHAPNCTLNAALKLARGETT